MRVSRAKLFFLKFYHRDYQSSFKNLTKEPELYNNKERGVKRLDFSPIPCWRFRYPKGKNESDRNEPGVLDAGDRPSLLGLPWRGQSKRRLYRGTPPGRNPFRPRLQTGTGPGAPAFFL